MDATVVVPVLFLAIIQGLAELLPVSSSAHVIVAETLLGVDPSTPGMTFLLVMLHTGTMFAVLLYYWPKWRALWATEKPQGFPFTRHCVIATGCTGVIGFGLKLGIERILKLTASKGEIEELFRNLPLMAASLLAAGILIIVSGIRANEQPQRSANEPPMTDVDALLIGLVQAICVPFRGFSRSGATISVGLLRRVPKPMAETFSFTLAVLLTPPALFLEIKRLLKAAAAGGTTLSFAIFWPGLIGMLFSFLTGLAALRWQSSWLANGKWHYFGIYCLFASLAVFCVYFSSQT